jgi:hypothetical protein
VANPYNQPVQVEVRPSVSASDPSSLLWTVGFGASARIDLVYGLSTPLNLNLAGYDQLRLDFGGLSSGLHLDGGRLQHQPIAANPTFVPVAFTVDFPLSAFTSNSGRAVDWSDIPVIDIIFQGGPDLACRKSPKPRARYLV